MGSIQNSSTSATLAASQNSNTQNAIKSTQASITALQPQVASATAQVQSASAKVSADYQALAADPTNKDLQTTLTTDLATLSQANEALSSVSNQLKTLLAQLPTLVSAAKAQDAAANSQQQTAANNAANEKDAQNTADEAQSTLDSAQTALSAGQAAFAKGSAKSTTSPGALGDSYASTSTSRTSATEGLNVSDSSSSGLSATSASGSAVNAGSILSQANINPSRWLTSNASSLSSQFEEGLFDNLLSALKGKSDGDGPSATGKSKKAAAKLSKAVSGGTGGASAGSLGAGSSAGGVGTLGAGASANSAIPSTFTSNTSANGGITANASSGSSAGKLGLGVASATAANDPQAAVNPSNLSANEIVMLVMLEATDELNKEMQGMAQQLQKATSEKTVLRTKLNNINGKINFTPNLGASASQQNAKYKAQSSNVQNDLDSIGDDTQMMQLRLQNLMQMQQQFVQAVSNISKNLNDTSMAILRHIGS